MLLLCIYTNIGFPKNIFAKLEEKPSSFCFFGGISERRFCFKNVKSQERRCFQIGKDEMAVKFCCCYAKLGNISEAAVMAGCERSNSLEWGMGILRKRKYSRLVSQLRSVMNAEVRTQVMAGLERLAFGDFRDAAMLVLREEPPTAEELQNLDLYNISEIKRVKGGGVEVKFFDRQKALEKMMEYAGNADQRAAAKSLLNALSGDDEDEV